MTNAIRASHRKAKSIARSARRTRAWVAAALFRVSKQHYNGAHIFFRELAASLPRKVLCAPKEAFCGRLDQRE
jgi:hypothetical protein